jgi:hypothetical protein
VSGFTADSVYGGVGEMGLQWKAYIEVLVS